MRRIKQDAPGRPTDRTASRLLAWMTGHLQGHNYGTVVVDPNVAGHRPDNPDATASS